MGFHLILSLDNQVLRPFTLWSDDKIWEDLKKLKITPTDNSTRCQETDTFPIDTFHLGPGKICRAYHTNDLMKSLSSHLCPPSGLGSTRALLVSSWTENSVQQKGVLKWGVAIGVRVWPSLLKSTEEHKVYLRSLSVLLLIGVCWRGRKEEPFYQWNKVMDRLPTYSYPEPLPSFQLPCMILCAAFIGT